MCTVSEKESQDNMYIKHLLEGNSELANSMKLQGYVPSADVLECLNNLRALPTLRK